MKPVCKHCRCGNCFLDFTASLFYCLSHLSQSFFKITTLWILGDYIFRKDGNCRTHCSYKNIWIVMIIHRMATAVVFTLWVFHHDAPFFIYNSAIFVAWEVLAGAFTTLSYFVFRFGLFSNTYRLCCPQLIRIDVGLQALCMFFQEINLR